MFAVFLFLPLLGTATSSFLLRKPEVVVLLSEVQPFSRMDFTPRSLLEVFIADLSISVRIELIVKTLELVFRDTPKPPVLEVKLELSGLYSSRFLNVHIHECLTEGLPLEFDLLQHSLFQVTSRVIGFTGQRLLCQLSPFIIIMALVLGETRIKLRVADRIMSKVKAL